MSDLTFLACMFKCHGWCSFYFYRDWVPCKIEKKWIESLVASLNENLFLKKKMAHWKLKLYIIPCIYMYIYINQFISKQNFLCFSQVSGLHQGVGCHGTLINSNHPTSSKGKKWWTERRIKNVSSFNLFLPDYCRFRIKREELIST